MALTNPRFASNQRLQRAARNAPAIRHGEPDRVAVAILQKALVDCGFAMPRSTRPDGSMDGIFGGETEQKVKDFQVKNGLVNRHGAADGIVGHNTMTTLDRVAPRGPAASMSPVSSTIRFNVPLIQQQFSPVCWLASAAMILQYKGRATLATADLGMQGLDFRTPGLTVPSEHPTGQQQQAELGRLGFVGVRSSSCTEEGLYQILRDHGPVILLHQIGMFSYGPGAPIPAAARGRGHAVVVTGLEVDRHAVFFNNPWGQKDVPTTLDSICGAIERWERNPANIAIWWL